MLPEHSQDIRAAICTDPSTGLINPHTVTIGPTGFSDVSKLVSSGELRLVTHNDGVVAREDGSTVLKADLSPNLKFRLHGSRTAVAFASQLAILGNDEVPERIAVDTYRGKRAVFDTNGNHIYWLNQGQLFRDDTLGPKFIGNVLRDQTVFWVGTRFGFGFYRAGGLQVGFVFDAEKGGINDSVSVPRLHGELVDAIAYFSESRCWFFVATEESGKTVHRCVVIKADGTVEATAEGAEGEEGEQSWLGSIRGRCAVTLRNAGGEVEHALFAITEQSGIVRVVVNNGTCVQTSEYPDTRNMISPDDTLLVSPRGPIAVGRGVRQRGSHSIGRPSGWSSNVARPQFATPA